MLKLLYNSKDYNDPVSLEMKEVSCFLSCSDRYNEVLGV